MPSSAPGPLPLRDFTLRMAVTIGLVVFALAAWKLREVLLLTFLATIIAIALQVPVRRLERLGLNRSLSILLTLVGLAVTFYLVGVLIVSVFLGQVSDLVNQLPDAFDQVRIEYDQQTETHDWLPPVNWDKLTQGDARDFLVQQAGNLSRNIFPFLSGVGGVVTNFVFIFFISLFFITDPSNYLEGILTLVPRDYRPRAFEIFADLGQTLKRWFIGQLISMTMLGAMIMFVTGVILGLPNPLALGVISGILEFIPNIGSIVSLIPALILALADDPAKAPWVIVAYLVTQQIQSNLIMPRIMSRQVSIPAALVLIAQVLAAALFGFMGLVLALPMAIVVVVVLREVYVFDVLNARPAQIETHHRPDGTPFLLVTSDTYRPERLSPGQAASLQAQGHNPFEVGDGQVVEIVTPASPALEQAVRGQQAVWLAILTLAVAQGLALVQSILSRREAD